MNLFFIKLIELVYKCIDSISMVFLEMLASVDKGIHNKTTKYGLPTY